MRLTYKDPEVVGGYNAIASDEFACVTKLGQLEDIEDKLGVDLITLHKALNDKWFEKKRYYTDKDHRIISHDGECTDLKRCVAEDGLEWYLEDRISLDWCLLKEHGKTWALTKEELE